MSAETKHFYEFGNFRLDPKEKILLRDNQPVSLTPKVFETLQVFVEHAGRLLEKDELMQKIWQDRFVAESNLTFNIKMLRRVLNDDVRRPRFIETVPRRGYRFIAGVKCVQGGAPVKPRAFETPTLSTPAVQKGIYFSLGAAAILLLIVIAIVWVLQRPTNASWSSAPILSRPFTAEKISSSGTTLAVISPDGKYVAYTAENGGRQSLWLRQLETSENIQIVPPSAGSYIGLAISQNGNSLYFVRRSEPDLTQSAIYRVMTFGGIPAKIVETNRGWVSVAPDDRQIAFVRCKQEDEDFCSLFLSNVDGTSEKAIVTRPTPLRIVDPEFSPDGNSIVFATGQSKSGASNFRLIRYDLTNGKEAQISSHTFFDIKSLKWLPYGGALLFTAQETADGPSRIWEVNTVTGETKPLTGDANVYAFISLSKTADKMTATYMTNTFQLYVAPLNDLDHAKPITTARTFTFAAPDKLIYASDAGDIWTINRDGSEHRQLTNNPFKDFAPRTSPDGRYVFFASSRSGTNHVWRMNMDGSDQIQLTQTEGGYPRVVINNWVYFESALSGTVWRVTTEGKELTQVSSEKVFKTSFSSNNKLVAYFYRPTVNDDHFRIAVMSLEDAKVVKTFSLPEANSPPVCIAWEPNNESFEYVTFSEKSFLWRQSLNRDNPTLVADLGPEEINDLALSPDGKFIGFVRGRWVHGAVLIQGLK